MSPSLVLALCALLSVGRSPTSQDPSPAKPAAAPQTLLGPDGARFSWHSDWAKLPEGQTFGNTHGGIAIDSKGRVYVNTDTEHAVIVFEPDGRFVRAWGREFRGGAHGMIIAGAGEQEHVILAHTQRHEVVGVTLEGKVLWTIPWPAESGHYQGPEEYAPTAVALAPDGRLFVADGYGKSWVHVYDSERKYLRSFGGPGDAAGRFHTPHGLFLDAAASPPRLIVADRENHRLQTFDLEGKWVATIDHDLRRPCGLTRHGQRYAVADLAGRVTLFDLDFKLVAHLGDQPDESLRAQNGVPIERFRDGEFISPHAARFDAAGNLYVMDWVSSGRITKLVARAD